ncbi:MAG: hypothetical protein IPK87_13185 [Planctomycetes bacterium]|nr:hypothetical protein [Planctomycetota bacterium]
MSKRLKVRKLPAGVKLGHVHIDPHHAPAESSHGRLAAGIADMQERQRYFNDCMESYAEFYGLAEITMVIHTYMAQLDAYQREHERRQRLADMMQPVNERWDISPNVALRAARALEQAIAQRARIKVECRDAALRAVRIKFDAPKTHDTAVTEEFVLKVPPRIEDDPLPNSTRPVAQPEPLLTPEEMAEACEMMKPLVAADREPVAAT